MANKHTGEVTFEAQGKTYTLRFSANAICHIEDALDKGIVALGQEMGDWAVHPENVRMKTIRAVLWAGLRESHPDVDLNVAGDIITEIGGIAGAVALISDAFALAFPQAKTKDARPTKKT